MTEDDCTKYTPQYNKMLFLKQIDQLLSYYIILI